ncbi:MAG: TrmB family transcriptional regulator [Vampirovibrionales bacterium]|nr:TrmB family transcriptional regulator [Vampirovibrionales bacterium]
MDNLIELVDQLKALGLNTYEAKVYLSLLKRYPATGYEVSKESGVPQARAYDTLKALEARGIVASAAGKPVTYLPISPDELLNSWESSFKESVSYLRQSLPQMTSETMEPILNIRGKQACIRHFEEMVNQARDTIFLEIWQQDAQRFEPVLREAAARGVDLKVVGYNDVSLDFCRVYAHSPSDDLGGRWLILSVDDRVGLVGNLPQGERIPKAVYTRNEGIVFIIRELVIHDIFLLELEQDLRPIFEEKYGPHLSRLREKIFGPGGSRLRPPLSSEPPRL